VRSSELTIYSDRIALIGCRAAARRAGTQLAIWAAHTMMTATVPVAAKSKVPTPWNAECRVLPTKNAPTPPT
jgi:hypothetical protein